MEEDFISQLRSEVIVEILSLLPESDIKRTRLLSKSWKNHWAFLPSLRFILPNRSSIEEVSKFHDFVDQTFAIRGNTHVQRFSLSLSKGWNQKRVHDWLCTVVLSKLQELELSFGSGSFRWQLINTSCTLINLTLREDLLLHLPDDAEFCFPCLKKIDIRWVVILGAGHTSQKFYANLISGCPALEELFLEGQTFRGKASMDRKSCEISSRSLKRLRLISVTGHDEFVLDVPELEYLDVCDVSLMSLSMKPSLSLMEARIKAEPDVVAQFLPCLSPVKILTIGGSTLERLISDVDGLNIPVFPNLVKFSLGRVSGRGWNMLWSLLGNMPNLEHLTFLDGFLPFPCSYLFHIDWHPAEEVPACLQFKMKEIAVLNRETIAQEEFESLRYLLEHANSLETLTINAHEVDAIAREQILNFRRGSRSCQIQFV